MNRLLLATEACGIGFWEWVVRSDRVYADAAMRRLYRLPSEPKWFPSAAFLQHVDPEDLPVVRATLQEAIRTKESYSVRFRLKTIENETRWVQARGLVEVDRRGRVLRIVGTNWDVSHEELQLDRLRQQDEILRQAGHLAKVGAWEVDLATMVPKLSEEALRIFGYGPDEEKTFDEILRHLPAEARASFEQAIRRSAATGSGWDLELPCLDASGRSLWVRAIGTVHAVNGRQTRLLGAIQDITERKLTEISVRRAAESMRTLLEALPDDVFVVDEQGRVASGHPVQTKEPAVLKDIAGSSLAGVVGLDPLELQNAIDQALASAEVQTLEFAAGEGDAKRAFESRVVPMFTDAEGARCMVLVREITDRRRAEEQAVRTAYTDTLTGLPNRRMFSESLGQVLKHSQARRRQVGLLHLDLDNFKYLNDSVGHEVGDLALVEAARRIAEATSAEHFLARLGGDEFVVVIRFANEKRILRSAEALLKSLSAPFYVAGTPVHLVASCGMALSREDSTPESIIREAEIALFQAKKRGKQTAVLFEEWMGVQARQRFEVEREMRDALDQRAFIVHFQPLVDLRSGQIAGAEALVRWKHPSLGIVSPGSFIPIAEETGLIRHLGDFVLEEACRHTAAWIREGTVGPEFRIHVNVAPLQFERSDLHVRIRELSEAYGILPEQIILEITESTMMEQVASIVPILNRLRTHGVKIALDDFGTGYSSLGRISKLPIDEVKIDRSFVTDLGDNMESVAIIRALIQLCRSIGIVVVAEGVETEEQLIHLFTLGCHVGQGFLFSRPLPPEEFREHAMRPWQGKDWRARPVESARHAA
ncbi:MAG: EAL domain-containing protein [Fimbriimonadaceae bacterium]